MKTLADLIRATVKDTGLEVSFRKSYSGRGMYGRSCIGITGSKAQCQKLIAEVITQMHYNDTDAVTFEEWCDKIMSFELDSMGYDVIMYWTAISPADLSEIEEEADMEDEG